MTETDQPALASPSGVVPDFAHPRDALRTVLLVTQCVCIPICSVLVVLRLHVRLRFGQQLGLDEYFGFVAWILFIGYCVTGIFLSKRGGGCYQWEIYKSELVEFMKISYSATLFYAPMTMFVKIALLTLLARVFQPYRKWVTVIRIVLAIVLAYYIPAFIIKARICNPVSAYWNGTDSGGSCLNQGKVIVADSVVSVATDLAILILPMPLTWSLHMPTEKKLKVIGLLSAGGLATGFSLYRLVMIIRDGQSPDQTMVFTRVVLTGNAEGAVGLICACLPALNILISRMPSSSKVSSSPGLRLSKVRRSHINTRRGYHEDDEDGLTFDSDDRTLIPGVSQVLPGSSDPDIQMQSGLGIMKGVVIHQSGSIGE